MLDRQMHKLFVERLVTVLKHMHPDYDPMEFFENAEWESDDADLEPEAWEAIGWIQGVADCQAVTILTLLDEEQIDLERVQEKALPKGRLRGRR